MTISKNLKEGDAPINILPEYKLRTMKDDLASLSPALPEEPKPLGPEPPKPPKPEPIPEPVKIEPAKPKKKSRLLPVLLIILIIVAIGGFLYWFGSKPEKPKPQPPIIEQPTPSEPLITVDETKILSLSSEIGLAELIKQEIEKSQTIETFKRIVILRNEAEFLFLNELIEGLNISIPPYALAELKDNYTLVVYSQDGKRRLGLVVETKNADNLKEQLRFWEQTMVNDLKNFHLIETLGQPATSGFQDNIYPPISPTGKQANIRYINFPEPGLTIDYTVMENLFILMTSKESMHRAIDRIVEKL